MQGCRDKYGAKGHRCDQTEQDRIDMSLRQPQSMVNYTETGFKKIKAPKELRDLLTAHWERNKDNGVSENWGVGNIYVNHWESPTHMVSVEDKRLRGGPQLKQKIWDAAKDTIQRWTGMELEPVSMYGIRVYTEGKSYGAACMKLPRNQPKQY
jgi:prolyl 4-hydroxylase